MAFGLSILAFLQLGLQIGNGSTTQGAVCDAAMLQCTAVETRAIVVVALTDDLAAAHNDAAMAVVQGRLRGLLEAKREIIVRLHFDVSGGFVGENWW